MRAPCPLQPSVPTVPLPPNVPTPLMLLKPHAAGFTPQSCLEHTHGVDARITAALLPASRRN
eukprot:6436697-Lingulodinium_polyedra.AAC.1